MKFSEFEIQSKSLSAIDSNTWHEILKLRSEIFVLNQQCIYVDPDQDDKSSLHLFSTMEERVIAYCRLSKNKHWHIGRVITHPEFRSQGLSNSLIQFVISLASAEAKPPSIVLSAQVYLTDYYQTHQFIPTGKMYLEDGIPHIQMVYQPR